MSKSGRGRGLRWTGWTGRSQRGEGRGRVEVKTMTDEGQLCVDDVPLSFDADFPSIAALAFIPQ